MDTAKLRLIVGCCGLLFGFAGLVTLGVALVVALIPLIGLIGATIAVALAFLSFASACIYISLLPKRATEDEMEGLEAMTADAIADLPINTVKSFVEKRPLAVTGIALLLGYTMWKNPNDLPRIFHRTLLGLLF